MSKYSGSERGETRTSTLWGSNRGERSSALWGNGTRGGEQRSSALWGKRGRGATTLLAVLALAVPLGAGAQNGSSGKRGALEPTFITPSLLAKAKTNPGEKIRIIIQSAAGAADAERAADRARSGKGSGQGSLFRRLEIADAVMTEIPAARLESLARHPGLTVTPDAPVRLAGYSSTQLWPKQNGIDKLWGTDLVPAPQAPSIAIVDSGIDKSHPCFANGNRVIDRRTVTRLPQDGSKLDGRGHGTFVAGIAACAAAGYAGAAPNATLIDLDVMDDLGRAFTSDVIAAADWILRNKDSKNIRVANFSLHSTTRFDRWFMDPLNRAVERLWFAGVVVTAASGNYGSATGPSGVPFAPGNDPFIITVGALDIAGSVGLGNDLIASWSAYGRTESGFAKPEVVASGRFMVGSVPMNSSLAAERADAIVADGYIQLSGTSFASPVVAGLAAQILARYPNLTPDQVKGLIMYGARPVPHATHPLQAGVGEVTATKSVGRASAPPTANLGLNRFVTTDPVTGALVFDAVSWGEVSLSDVSWDSVSFSDVSWAGVSWDSLSWSDVSWGSVSLTDVSLSDVSLSDMALEDGTGMDSGGALYELTPEEAAAAEADPDLQLPGTEAASELSAPTATLP